MAEDQRQEKPLDSGRRGFFKVLGIAGLGSLIFGAGAVSSKLLGEGSKKRPPNKDSKQEALLMASIEDLMDPNKLWAGKVTDTRKLMLGLADGQIQLPPYVEIVSIHYGKGQNETSESFSIYKDNAGKAVVRRELWNDPQNPEGKFDQNIREMAQNLMKEDVSNISIELNYKHQFLYRNITLEFKKQPSQPNKKGIKVQDVLMNISEWIQYLDPENKEERITWASYEGVINDSTKEGRQIHKFSAQEGLHAPRLFLTIEDGEVKRSESDQKALTIFSQLRNLEESRITSKAFKKELGNQ